MKVTGGLAGLDCSRVPTPEQQLQDVLLQQLLPANSNGDTLAASFQKLPAAMGEYGEAAPLAEEVVGATAPGSYNNSEAARLAAVRREPQMAVQ